MDTRYNPVRLNKVIVFLVRTVRYNMKFFLELIILPFRERDMIDRMLNVYILLLICAHTYSFHQHHYQSSSSSNRLILNNNKNIQTKWCQLKVN